MHLGGVHVFNMAVSRTYFEDISVYKLAHIKQNRTKQSTQIYWCQSAVLEDVEEQSGAVVMISSARGSFLVALFGLYTMNAEPCSPRSFTATRSCSVQRVCAKRRTLKVLELNLSDVCKLGL